MFVWNEFRRKRLASAVRAYNAAITRAQKALDAKNAGAYKVFLPDKITVAEVKSRINTQADFRRIVGYAADIKRGRTSELSRILKSVNPKALEIDYKRGDTNYQYQETKYHQQAIKRERKRLVKNMQTELFEGDKLIDFDAMSAAELLTATTNNIMGDDLDGEIDTTVEELSEEVYNKWRLEDARNKRAQITVTAQYYEYMEQWTNPKNKHSLISGYDTVIHDMEWLHDNAPDVLNKAFAGGYDELDIPFILFYPTKNNPYNNIDFEVRHNRVVKFIHNLYLANVNKETITRTKSEVQSSQALRPIVSCAEARLKGRL